MPLQQTNAGEDVEKREHFCAVGRNTDWCSHCGKQYGDTSKKLKIVMPFDPAILILGIHPKEPQTLIQKNISTPMFIVALFTIAKIWKQPVSISRQVDKKLWGIYMMEFYSAIKK